MSNRTEGLARRILLILPGSMLCSAFSCSATEAVPVVLKPQIPGELLRLCEEPERPSRDKTVPQNSAAIVDMEAKFEECAARHAGLVDVVK